MSESKIPFGRVVLDATPVEVPTRLQMLSRADQIREFIRHEISMQASAQGHESFEEADDFNIDESEPLTPYELAMLDGEIQPLVEKIRQARQQLRNLQAEEAAQSAAAASPPPSSGDTPSPKDGVNP